MDKKVYNTWSSMLERCRSTWAFGTYKDVTVCEEWYTYSNFEKWYMKNIYEFDGVLELDKDLFSKDKKIYSPETCCFLPKYINNLLSTIKSRNAYLPGVTINIGKRGITYTAAVKHNNKKIKKTYKTQKEAFIFYKDKKEKIIQEAANKYKGIIPEHIYNALMNYEIPMTCPILEDAIRNKDKMRPDAYQRIINEFQM